LPSRKKKMSSVGTSTALPVGLSPKITPPCVAMNLKRVIATSLSTSPDS
jgi:hypothetical protein